MKRSKNEGPCCVDGCEKKALARGRCVTHYHRWWRAQDPERMSEHRRRRQKEWLERRRVYNRLYQRARRARKRVLAAAKVTPSLAANGPETGCSFRAKDATQAATGASQINS